MRLALILCAMMATACGGGGDDAGDPPFGPGKGSGGTVIGGPPAASGPGTFSVAYVVTGTGTEAVDLTYSTASGGYAQQANVALPAVVQLGSVAPGAFLYVSAQNKGASGTIDVAIKVNEKPYRVTTSNGAFVVATASGSCCGP